jgi:hypothetical protein
MFFFLSVLAPANQLFARSISTSLSRGQSLQWTVAVAHDCRCLVLLLLLLECCYWSAGSAAAAATAATSSTSLLLQLQSFTSIATVAAHSQDCATKSERHSHEGCQRLPTHDARVLESSAIGHSRMSCSIVIIDNMGIMC